MLPCAALSLAFSGMLTEAGLDALAPLDGPAGIAALKKAGQPARVGQGDVVAGVMRTTLVCFDPDRATDSHVLLLRHATELRWVVLTNCRVGDAGLRFLCHNKKLAVLELNGTAVTDAGMKSVRSCENLAHLDLRRTAVTGAGLMELKGMKNILYVILSKGAAPAVIAASRESSPRCRVNVE